VDELGDPGMSLTRASPSISCHGPGCRIHVPAFSHTAPAVKPSYSGPSWSRTRRRPPFGAGLVEVRHHGEGREASDTAKAAKHPMARVPSRAS
jgi:hypothetical protein